MIGQTLSHYRITGKLGAGGMGEVYRATDTRLGREVAIKVLPENFAQDADRLARFQREAQLLASLNHANIAAIHGLEEAGGRRYLVLEYVPGETLASRVARVAIPREEALQLARQIAEALEAAHEKGIIHRDLKPGNIALTADGTVKVLDFGLAKALEGESAAVDPSQSPTLSLAATHAGLIMGTAAYMSPEQARGAAVDKRADIWAFGCVLYEMLTGRRAFTGDTASDTLASVLKVEPDWKALPADTPPKLHSLLRRCLNKNAKQRLHDIGDVRLEIEELIAGKTEILSAASDSAARMAAAPEAKWRRVLPWGIATALGLALLLLGWNRWQARQTGLTEQVRFEIAPPGNEIFAVPAFPMAVLSPNGKKLAFITGLGLGGNLYLRNLDDLEARPLAGVSDAHNLFFSPDSKWVGFTTGGKMMKVSVDGGAPVPVCDAEWGGGAWGVDGRIIFSRSYNSGLWRVSADGGQPEKFTEPDVSRGELAHWWPQFLPSGEWVLFTNFGTPIEKARIEALSLKTKEKRVLVEGAVYGKYAPTGHLLFFRGKTLFAAPFDAAKLAVTGASFPVLDDVSYWPQNGFAALSFSENGTAAYLTSSAVSRSQSLVWIDRKGNATPVSAAPGTYEQPRLSPDGKRVAYASKEAGALLDIWVRDLERGTRSRLTHGPATVSAPVWTPDGKRIIYLSERPVFDLYWRAADESAPEEALLTSRNDKQPTSVSPDGKWLLFRESGAETGEDIYVLPLQGEHKPQAWRKTPFNEEAAMYSPDGRWVAYSSNDSARSEVYVQAAAGTGGRWQISTEGGFEPVWARNGRELFYRQGDEIMAVPISPGPEFKAGKPAPVFKERFQRRNEGANYDVSPDGQRFLIPREDTQFAAQVRIHVVLNWFEELEKRAGKQ